MDDTHAKAYATNEELIDLLRRNNGDVGEMFRPVIEPTITFKSQLKPNIDDDPYADPVEDHWHRRLEKLAEQNEY